MIGGRVLFVSASSGHWEEGWCFRYELVTLTVRYVTSVNHHIILPLSHLLLHGGDGVLTIDDSHVCVHDHFDVLVRVWLGKGMASAVSNGLTICCNDGRLDLEQQWMVVFERNTDI